MSTLYEIDEALFALIDAETGELSDYEEFERLQMEREQKIEGVALWHKDLLAQAEAIKSEERSLAERRRSIENKAERLKQYVDRALQGKTFETPKVSVKYRVSKSVEVGDEFAEWAQENGRDDLLRFAVPSPDKAAIKEAINGGAELKFASIVCKNNISIK